MEEAQSKSTRAEIDETDRVLITEVSGTITETPLPFSIPSIQISAPPEIAELIVEPEIESAPAFSDVELQAAFTAFHEQRTVPPIAMKIDLTQFVHWLISEAIDNEEYDTAEQMENDLRELSVAWQHSDIENLTFIHSQSLESRLEEVRQKQIAIEADWTARIAQAKAKQTEQLEFLEQKHQEERELFEQKCQTPDFLQRFTKPSPQLLSLWRHQKTLALQHDFEGAKDIKARADELQRRETVDAQTRAMNSVRQHYELLLLKQKREIECAKANNLRKIKAMELEMNKAKEAAERLNKQVEIRMKDQRPPLKRSVLPRLQRAQRDGTSGGRRALRPRAALNEQISGQLDIKIGNIKAVLGGGKSR
jgi:hypothetical protein